MAGRGGSRVRAGLKGKQLGRGFTRIKKPKKREPDIMLGQNTPRLADALRKNLEFEEVSGKAELWPPSPSRED